MQLQPKQLEAVTEDASRVDVPMAEHGAGRELAEVDSAVLVDALIARNPEPAMVLRWSAQDPAYCPVIAVNESFTKLTGFSQANLAGEKNSIVMQLFGTPTAKRRARNAVATGKSDRISSSLKPRAGRELSVDAAVIPIAGVAGQAGFVLIFLHDVTELKRSADVGVVAEQDIRNILTSARCIVWHAFVERGLTEEFCWQYETANEEAAIKWLPIEVWDGEPFFAAFGRSVHPEDRPVIDINCRQAMETGLTRYRQEFRCRLASGEYRWIAEDVEVEAVDEGAWRLIGVGVDITEQKKAKEELADERNLLRTLIDNIPDAIYFKDTKSRFIVANRASARELGVEISENLAGTTDFDFFPYEVATELYMNELSIIQSGIPVIDKEESYRVPGGKAWQLITKVPLRDGSGNVVGLIGINRDVTAQKKLEVERERLLEEAIDRADRDPLTGLWNHRAFQRRLEEEADLAMVRETSVGIVVMDMDNFRFFNDAYGHTVGDEVLCHVARTLRAACRDEDTLARFGGDEFAVLMPLKNPDTAEDLAKKITSSLDELCYRPQGFDAVVPIRVSWGLAVYPDEAAARLDALSLADGRLMRAKSGIGEAGELMERLSQQLSDSVKGFNMLSALVNAVDNKDRYTRRHSEDVLLYALQIAIDLGLDDTTCHTVQVAALLHDVGKIGVPDHILRKPARLTPEEYDAIKLHPTMGAIIVSSVKGFEYALPAVQFHHERWDGLGYPDGLRGEQTPLIARILAVADAYSAMTTDRPYRKGMSAKVALEILEEGAGAQWDPELVKAFAAVRRRKRDV